MTRPALDAPRPPPAAIWLVTLLAFAGCDSADDVWAPSETAAPGFTLHAPGESVPLSGRGTAVLVMQQRAPGFGPPSFGRSDFGGRCSTPADVLQRFELTGEALYLGRFTAVLEHCTRIDFQAGRAEWGDGTSVFTAANGDELWDTYSGQTAPSGVGFEDEAHLFDGGTGRFEDASGIGLFDGSCDQVTGACVFDFDGFLAFDASGRRD